MKTHKLSTKVLAMLLTLVMVLGMVPTSVFAVEAKTGLTLTWGGNTAECADIAAVNAKLNEDTVNNVTVTLNENIAEMGTSLVIPAGKQVTVDLNGKNMTSAIGANIPVDNGVGFRLAGAGSNLTIKGTGTVTTAATVIAMVNNKTAAADNHAVVNLNGGTLKTPTFQGVCADGNMDINLKGATIEAPGDNVFYGGNVHVVNGTITGGGYPVFKANTSLVIDNGEVTANNYLISADSKAVINGGTFKTKGQHIGEYTDFGYEINGGKFYCTATEFYGSAEAAFVILEDGMKIKQGYEAVRNAEGGFFEVKSKAPVAKGVLTLTWDGNTAQCADIAAVNAKLSEDTVNNVTVTLNENIAEMGTSLVIPAGKQVTVDLNGKNMTSAIGANIPADNGVGFRLAGAGSNLTIKGTGTVTTAATVIAMVNNKTAAADNHAVVNLNGGTLKTPTFQGVCADGNMDINLNGATIEAPGDNVFYGGNVHVVNGTITGGGYPVFKANTSLVIDNGEVTANNFLISAGSKAVINSGTFKTKGQHIGEYTDFGYEINGGKFYCTATEFYGSPDAAFVILEDGMKIKQGFEAVRNAEGGFFEVKEKAPPVPALDAPTITRGKTFPGNSFVSNIYGDDLTKGVVYLQENYLKVSAVSGADKYYFVASLTERTGITPDTVVAEGVELTANTFVRIKNKAGEVVKPGFNGGNIYLYVVASGAAGKSAVVTATYPVRRGVVALSNIKTNISGPCLEGENVTVIFSESVAAQQTVYGPIDYFYQIGEGEKIAIVGLDDNDNTTVKTREVSLTVNGPTKITFYGQPHSDTAGEFAGSKSIELTTVPKTDDMTLTWGVGQSRKFTGALLGRVGDFMKTQNITKATLTLSQDVDNFVTSLVVPVGAELTLDLNGYNLISTTPNVNIQGGFDVRATTCAKSLTIKDSTNSGTATITTASANSVVFGLSANDQVAVNGKLNISNVTISGGIEATCCDMTIENATIGGNMVIYTDGIRNFTNMTFKGSIAQDHGTMTLKDCTANTTGEIFDRTWYATVTVDGGSYTTAGKTIWGAMDDAKTTIQGDVTFKCASTKFEDAFGPVKPNFPAGKFLQYDETAQAFKLKNLAITDTGAVTFTPVNGQAQTGLTVEKAFEEANKAGGTVLLTGDTTLSGNLGLTVSKNVVLDLNGYTLTLAPAANTDRGGAINVAKGGALTVQDSSDAKTGKLDVSACGYGITISGSDANFTLLSGTIGSSKIWTVSRATGNMADGDKDYIGTVTISGGKLLGNGERALYIAGDEMNGSYSGKIIINGGEIIATGSAQAVLVADNNLTINGTAKISSEASGAVRAFNDMAVEISGDAVITSSGTQYAVNLYSGGNIIGGNARIDYNGAGDAIFVELGDVTINGQPKLESTGKSIIHDVGSVTITVNGGLFQMSGKTLPFVQGTTENFDYGIKTVTYMADDSYKGENANMKAYILNPVADKDGYYNVVKRQDVHLKNQLDQDVGYQNFEEFKYSFKVAYDLYFADDPENPYTAETKAALEAALMTAMPINDAAADYPNLSQYEINALAADMDAAIANLKTVNEANPSKLADGIYEVGINAFKNQIPSGNSASMTSGALEPKAQIVVKDGKAELHVFFKPTVVMDMVGHLVNLYYFEGNTPEENRANANTGTAPILCQTVKYYTIPADDPNGMNILDQVGPNAQWDQERTKDPNTGYDKTPVHFPREVVMPLNFLGTENGYDRYVCRVSVDKMNELDIGEQNVDFVIRWSTLKPVDVKTTLNVDTAPISLVKGGVKTVTAEVLGADGYTITWTTDNEKVATVADGKITAVGAGNATITVTATKAGAETLTKTISVTVAADGQTEVKVENIKTQGDQVSAEITGDVLVSGGDNTVENTADKIIVNAKTSAAGVKTAEILMKANTADALADANKVIEIQTDVGTIKLDGKLLDQIAAQNQNVVLTVSEIAKPANLAGTFTVYYSVELTVNGQKVEFNGGTATVTVPAKEGTKFAYHIVDGKIKDKKVVSVSGDTMSWTTDHFSDWALSAKEYQIDDSKEPEVPGYFLEDGNYYVDIALWHATENRASMGDDAFANNRKALITVKDGKITLVQIATNPVDVGSIHSAIVSMKADGKDVTILESGKLITRPANQEYTRIKRASFPMPASAQPELANEITYVKLDFVVPDTPMDEVVSDLTARLKFTWSTAKKTTDTELKQDDHSNVTETPAVDAVDQATGIKVHADKNVFIEGVQLVVDPIVKGESGFDSASKLLAKKGSKFQIFEIHFENESGTEVQPNGPVTVSYKIPADYDAAKVVVYRVNEDGTLTKIAGTAADGYFTVTQKHFSVYALVDTTKEAPAVNPFVDVKENAWYYESVRWAVENKITAGITPTRFDPDRFCTRAQAVTFLWRAAGEPKPQNTKNPFTDLNEKEYYMDAILWASENGIAAGYPNGTFEPEATCTRAQIVTFLWRAQGAPEPQSTKNPFPEIAAGDWYYKAVLWAAENGIAAGFPDGSFKPAAKCTRAQIVTFMNRNADLTE